MSGIALTAFGQLTIRSGGGEPLDLPTSRARALLIYLAVERALGAESHGREALTELLWPGMLPASGRKNLRQTLYYLRRAIPRYADPDGNDIPLLLAGRQALSLNASYPVELDVDRFLDLMEGPAGRWDEGLNLYLGEFLADFSLPDANPFEAWSAARKAAFHNQALAALDVLARNSLENTQYESAEDYARRALELDPLRETAWRGLMMALVLAGRRSEALATYRLAARALQNELGVEPSAETEALYRQILDGTPNTITKPVAPQPAADYERPRHNLPAQKTSFIGRGSDLIALEELIGREDVRLVTLSGPGGIGKTRLSIELACRLLGQFPDGVVFTELAKITDPGLILNEIAATLGLQETREKPLIDSITRFLGVKSLLLVVDNVEHVIDGASVLGKLLASAPNLKIITSSREILKVYGEYDYPVNPLTLPDPDRSTSAQDISNTPAIALFVERAGAARRGFTFNDEYAPVIAQICARLDGLPLAIELAAARIRLLSPEDILEGLARRFQLLTGGARDAPSRQQTLQNTIDWSYNLLQPGERQLLARLSVFQGGRTLKAVGDVCGPGLTIDPLSGLESLLDKSLLIRVDNPRSEPRFVLLETIHEFARAKLADFDEVDELQLRHGRYFLSFVEGLDGVYDGPDYDFWSASFRAELDNIRAAIERSLDREDYETPALIYGYLGTALHYEGYHGQGRRWADHLLPHLDGLSDKTQLTFLTGLGRIGFTSGYPFEQLKNWLSQGVDLARSLGGPIQLGRTLLNIATFAILSPEDKDQFAPAAVEALEIFRKHNHVHWVIKTLTTLGEISRYSGDFVSAWAAYEEALELSIQTGRHFRAAILHSNMAMLAHTQGDFEKAISYHRENIRSFVESGNLYGMMNVAALAGTLTAIGQAHRAARLIGAADSIRLYFDTVQDVGDRHLFEQYEAETRQALGVELFEKLYREGQRLSLNETIQLALAGG